MKKTKSLPLVTVILPIRNEALYIESALDAVLTQDYPSDRMEVLIVDGMSDDGTREICNQIIQQVSSIPILVIDNPKKIVSAALNIGFQQANGEIIIRVDGHCEIAPDYISECVKYLLDNPEDDE